MNWTADWLPLWMVGWLLAAWGVPRRWQPTAMAATGAAFLAWADWRGLAAIAGGAVVAGLLLRGPPSRGRSALVVAAIVAGLVVAKWQVRIDGAIPAVVGISFAALRLVHLAVETGMGRLRIDGFGGVMRYLLLFPAVIAGPVHRLEQQLRDEQRRRWDSAAVAVGAERILYGYAKIVVCSGWISYKISFIDTSAWSPALSGWFTCFMYGWNLYFQFSGYSDVAIGLARAAGFRLPENFDRPFLAADIQEFWRRWHASLSAWCQGHVAGPVMAATRNPWLGAIAAMLVLGLWHEFSLRYCAWGLFHGIGIAICLWWRSWAPRPPSGWTGILRRVLAVLTTQVFVVLSFAITSTPDLGAGLALIARMFGAHS